MDPLVAQPDQLADARAVAEQGEQVVPPEAGNAASSTPASSGGEHPGAWRCRAPRRVDRWLHHADPRRDLRTSSETKEVCFIAPDRLDRLDIHPSMRLRIDRYLQRRSAPYIG
jgi:hypothetical protein